MWELSEPTSRADTISTPVRRRRRRRRRSRLRRQLRWLVFPVALLLALSGLVGLRAWEVASAARALTADAALLATALPDDPTTLSAADLAQLAWQLDSLARHLERIDVALALPGGLEGAAERLPWLGPRYRSLRAFVLLGESLARGGQRIAVAGQATLAALDRTGLTGGSGAETTWLEALHAHEADLRAAQQDLTAAREERAAIDPALLPGPARAQLPTLDRVLNQTAKLEPLWADLPALERALGIDGPIRYLVLFQNPAELRPSGGFPGVIAVVTIDHGRISDYVFYESHELTDRYLAVRTQPVPLPYPIATYFPTGELFLHDATWWADFPRGAALTLKMYNQIGFPPALGVIAVQPSVASALVGLTGPFAIQVDGEMRTITAENVYEEIERPRQLRREGKQVDVTHKQVLARIGTELVERLRQAPRATLLEAARQLVAAAARRDLQIYSADPLVQERLEQRGWSGRLVPDPKTPTIAVTLANLVLNKGSLALRPELELAFAARQGSTWQATLTLRLTNTARNEDDPFYGGFQRWWIEVTLPPGSQVRAANKPAAPDPEAPNGGSYVIEIFPQQQDTLTLEVQMPATEVLLVRRQPGVQPITLRVSGAGCTAPVEVVLQRDVRLDLAAGCRIHE